MMYPPMETLDYQSRTRPRPRRRVDYWIMVACVILVLLLGLDAIFSPMIFSKGGGATLTVTVHVVDQSSGQPIIGALVQVHDLRGASLFVFTDTSGTATLHAFVVASHALKSFYYHRISYTGGRAVDISAAGYGSAQVQPTAGKTVKILGIGPNPSFRAEVLLKPMYSTKPASASATTKS